MNFVGGQCAGPEPLFHVNATALSVEKRCMVSR